MDLDGVYANPSAPGSFSGVRILKRYGKRSERETKKLHIYSKLFPLKYSRAIERTLDYSNLLYV